MSWIAAGALTKLRVLRWVTALLRGAPCHFSLFSHGVSPWNAGFSNAQNRVTRNDIVVLPDDDRIDKPAPTNDCEQLVALFIRVRAVPLRASKLLDRPTTDRRQGHLHGCDAETSPWMRTPKNFRSPTAARSQINKNIFSKFPYGAIVSTSTYLRARDRGSCIPARLRVAGINVSVTSGSLSSMIYRTTGLRRLIRTLAT